MKKLLSLFLVLAINAGVVYAGEYDHVLFGDLYYNLDTTNQTAEVEYTAYRVHYNYYGLQTAIIPSSVRYNSVTYSVTSIGDYAFYLCTSLKSVEIPKSLTNIGVDAFWGCSKLTSITPEVIPHQ